MDRANRTGEGIAPLWGSCSTHHSVKCTALKSREAVCNSSHLMGDPPSHLSSVSLSLWAGVAGVNGIEGDGEIIEHVSQFSSTYVSRYVYTLCIIHLCLIYELHRIVRLKPFEGRRMGCKNWPEVTCLTGITVQSLYAVIVSKTNLDC